MSKHQCCEFCAYVNYTYSMIDRIADETRGAGDAHPWIKLDDLQARTASGLSLPVQAVNEFIKKLKADGFAEYSKAKGGIRRTLTTHQIVCDHFKEMAA